MTLRLILVAGVLALAGCAHRDPALPTCDGSARRPANPHGSVLTPTPARAAEPAVAPPAHGGCA